MKSLENKLTVAIATYNRSSLLGNTLQQLSVSPIKNCHIVIMNNCSTDNTVSVIDSYRMFFPKLSVITNSMNVGGSANLIRAVEYCKTDYMWILADDDSYCFDCFTDVVDAILCDRYDLIQVGGHVDSTWDWGMSASPRVLTEKGYNYFKYSSFLPCTIFRANYFRRFIMDAYAAISIRYLHMPCLISAYKEDKIIYVSKKRVVNAVIGNQAYNNYIPIRGFAFLSMMLDDRKTKRLLMLSQYSRNLAKCYLVWIYRGFIPRNMEGFFVRKAIFECCTLSEKVAILVLYLPVLIMGYFLHRLR